jgi:LacI family transcriptional regulator
MLRMPIVLFDRQTEDQEDSVTLAHRTGIRSAMKELFELGHERIGLITGSRDVWPGRERIAAVRAAYVARGLRFDPTLVRSGQFTTESAFSESSILLGLPNRPTAIIAGGISMLPGLISAVRLHDLRIPEDISIVASGDSDLAQLVDPQISVIHWDYGELGRTAAQLLLSRLDGKAGKAPRRISYPTEFLMRGSCGAPGQSRQS